MKTKNIMRQFLDFFSQCQTGDGVSGSQNILRLGSLKHHNTSSGLTEGRIPSERQSK